MTIPIPIIDYDKNENELKVTPSGRNVMVLTGILGCTVTKINLVQ